MVGHAIIAEESKRPDCVRALLRAALSLDVATTVCAGTAALAGEDRAAIQAAEMRRLASDGISGIPVDGNDSYRIPPDYAHPRVLSRYQLPHLTPPVDRKHTAYIKAWRQARQASDEYGIEAPNEAFYSYFMEYVGTTVTCISGGLFEVSLRDVRCLCALALSLALSDMFRFLSCCSCRIW